MLQWIDLYRLVYLILCWNSNKTKKRIPYMAFIFHIHTSCILLAFSWLFFVRGSLISSFILKKKVISVCCKWDFLENKKHYFQFNCRKSGLNEQPNRKYNKNLLLIIFMLLLLFFIMKKHFTSLLAIEAWSIYI